MEIPAKRLSIHTRGTIEEDSCFVSGTFIITFFLSTFQFGAELRLHQDFNSGPGIQLAKLVSRGVLGTARYSSVAACGCPVS